jgi:hypothetical protein
VAPSEHVCQSGTHGPDGGGGPTVGEGPGAGVGDGGADDGDGGLPPVG